MAATTLPVSLSGIVIAQQPLGQIHWKSMTTKFILHSTIPYTFSVVALFFVRRGTIMSIHQRNTCSSPPLFQNNIIFNYEARLYSTGHYAHNNQSTDASRQQSTNNTTIIIHPWHPSSILEVSLLRFSLVYALQVLLTPPMKSNQPCISDPGNSLLSWYVACNSWYENPCR